MHVQIHPSPNVNGRLLVGFFRIKCLFFEKSFSLRWPGHHQKVAFWIICKNIVTCLEKTEIEFKSVQFAI